MAEEKKSGFLLINKQIGPTSHDIIDKLRRITGIKKIGHAGTLDPFASGLLIVAVGREATREISKFVKLDKVYETELRLGMISDTHDNTGKVEPGIIRPELRQEEVESVLKKFIGEQKQVPPMYSAKKVKGKKLYQLARQGKTIKREPADIKIFDIKLLKYKWPELKIKVHVSSGTYIRALARDIGRQLKCGAYLEELKRTAIGNYNLDQAKTLNDLEESNWHKLLISV